MNKNIASLFVIFILFGSILLLSPLYATTQENGYDDENDISPITFSPLLKSRLSTASILWGSLMDVLPDELPDEQFELLEKISSYMNNAASVSNPLYASGQVDKAIEAMKELGCAYSEDMASAVLNENDNAKTFSQDVGDVIVIELSENASTGYSWDFTVSSGLLVVCDTYDVSQSGENGMMVGVPGIRNLTVMVISEGAQSIKGTYIRPWMPKDVASMFTIYID